MTETNYSPLPLVAIGAPEEPLSTVRVQCLEGQHDWLEMYPQRARELDSQIGGASVMLDEFDIDIALGGNLITGISAGLAIRRYDSLVNFPRFLPSEPTSVRLVLDYDPELECTYEYASHLLFRSISERGCYVGWVPVGEVPKWIFCSAGFWIGSNDEASLCALLIPFDKAASTDYRRIVNSRRYRTMRIFDVLLRHG